MSIPPTIPSPPDAIGLYDPSHEHDACGVGFIVDIKGRRSHSVVRKGLQILINLLHRGACGCEANTGDGAGILIQTPDKFLRKVTAAMGALKAAAMPAAIPTDVIRLRYCGFNLAARASRLLTPAQICTVGPSRPSDAPDPICTAHRTNLPMVSRRVISP